MQREIRPMTEDDVEAAVRVRQESFDAHDRAFGDPVPPATPERLERQRRRVRHLLTHDPGGAWVATEGGHVVGVSLALRRDRLWGLSLFAVDPAWQGNGLGRPLLDATLTYADPDGPAVIMASRDPRAIRCYLRAGFDLHPQMRAAGRPDLARLGSPELGRSAERVRPGAAADHLLADAVDLLVRGAGRGADHEVLHAGADLLVVDDDGGRGYAYLREGAVAALAATDEATATDLLLRCLARAARNGEEALVDHLAAGQQWALQTVSAAGLAVSAGGPGFWRGMAPPAAYLPSGPYL